MTSSSYKVAVPRLSTLTPEAVEKFETRWNELSGIEGEDAVAPILLLSQQLKDELDSLQLLNPVQIRPPSPGGGTGQTLKWPDHYAPRDKSIHLFQFLRRHAMPDGDSDQETLLRSLKINNSTLDALTVSTVSSDIGNFKRRAQSTSLGEKTQLSIFTGSFLSTQPHLQTHVKDKKPSSLADAIKHFLVRLQEIEKARKLIQSTGLFISSKKPKIPDETPRNPKKNDEKKTPPTTNDNKNTCLACGKDHFIGRCPDGPWEYSEDYKIIHTDTKKLAPNKMVPDSHREMADRYRKHRNSNNRATSADAELHLAQHIVHMGVAVLPGAVSSHKEDNMYTSDFFWDSCASRTMIDPDIYDALVADGSTPVEVQPIPTNTWTGTFDLQQYIEIDITLSYPVVRTELTFRTRAYKGPQGTTAGSISHTDLHRTGLDARLLELMTMGQSDEPPSVNSGHNKRADINIPTFNPPEQHDAREEEVESGLQPGDQLNAPGELPEVFNDADGVLKSILSKHAALFPAKMPAKPAKLRKMKIILIDPDKTLPYRRARRLSNERRRLLRKEVDKLLKSKTVRKSLSPNASFVVLVRKPNGSWRFTVAYTELNRAIEPCAYPLPRIDDIIDSLRGKTHFAVMDLRSGYHQMELDESCKHLTAFVTPDGLYEYNRVPQGLSISPPKFSEAVAEVLAGKLHIICELYIDDIVVYGTSIRQLASNLDEVLQALEDAELVLKANKCKVGMTEIKYLGHVVNGDEVKIDPDRTKAIRDLPPPTSQKQVRSFLGCCQFVRAFVHDFARIAKPLTILLKQNEQFRWGSEQEEAFQRLKSKISDTASLSHFDPDLPTQIRCDASKAGIGAVLVQDHGGTLRPVAYLSRTFSDTESRWTTIEQECYSIFYSITKWRHYLQGHKFSVLTDHRNLTYLYSCTSPKVERWAAALLGYTFAIRHLPGTQNQTADCLSRVACAAAATVATEPDPHRSMIQLAHNSIQGHGGVFRTIRLLDRWGMNWPKREADVRKYIQSCPSCQATEDKSKSPPLQSLRGITRDQPFARLALDLIGRYPVDAHGNRYILLAVCSATRFVELIPIKDKSARTVADALLQLFGRYGPYREIHSDRGTEFVNEVNDAVLESLNIGRSTGIAHRPQTNGQAERHVQETTRHVRHLIYDDQSMRQKWSIALPICQRIQNATVLNPTDSPDDHVTPVGLMFAGRVQPDRFLFKTASAAEPVTDATTYIAERRDIQQRMLERAKSTVRQPSITTPDPAFKRHDLVMLAPPSRPMDKLAPKLQGPFPVTSVQGNVISLLDTNTTRTRQVYADRLRRWKPAPGIDPAREAAKTHNTEYVVENIVAHRRNPDRKGKLTPAKCMFQVKWQDFNETTWEPYANVHDSAALDDYLESNPITNSKTRGG